MNRIAPLTNIRELITLQRSRVLSADGTVFAELNQEFSARDIVAQSTFGNQHLMLNAATALGLPPKRAAKFLQRDVGEKVEKGDILVSQATSPDLLPAMRKAGAMVTNTGGLICHAAITSRELKIPCIVGTKNATYIFKDGDRVEVDATKGIVRKI